MKNILKVLLLDRQPSKIHYHDRRFFHTFEKIRKWRHLLSKFDTSFHHFTKYIAFQSIYEQKAQKVTTLTWFYLSFVTAHLCLEHLFLLLQHFLCLSNL